MPDNVLEAELFAAIGTKQGHRRHAEPDCAEIQPPAQTIHVWVMPWDGYIERHPEGYRHSRSCERSRLARFPISRLNPDQQLGTHRAGHSRGIRQPARYADAKRRTVTTCASRHPTSPRAADDGRAR